MNAGEVENPKAFDSDASVTNETSVGAGATPPEPNQATDPDEPIGDDGVNYDVYADNRPASDSTASENPTDINFSAEDIRKRRKTEYFVNIQGAEKLKREAERKRAAEEKRILSEQRRAEKETAQAEKAAAAKRARQRKYDDAQEKNALKEAAAEEKRQRKLIAADKRKTRNAAIRQKIASFFKFLWRGWHKFVVIGLVVMLTVAGIIAYNSYQYYITVTLPKEQRIQEANSLFDQRESYMKKIISEMNSVYNDGEGDGYNKAIDKAKKLLAEARKEKNNTKLFYYTTEYARFILQTTPLEHEKILELLDSALEIAENDVEKATAYNLYILVYFDKEDMEMVEEYQNKIKKLDIQEDEEGGHVKE